MTRSLSIWAPFGVCVALVLAAMGWVSSVALRLDAEQTAARAAAALEENARLALWRMDYAVGPLVAEAASRPYFAYASFYPPSRAYTNMFREVNRGEVLLPSPLLAPLTPFVQLYFQIDRQGVLSSPQAPTGQFAALATAGFIGPEQLEEASNRVAALGTILTSQRLEAALPTLVETPMPSVTMCSATDIGGAAEQARPQAPHQPPGVPQLQYANGRNSTRGNQSRLPAQPAPNSNIPSQAAGVQQGESLAQVQQKRSDDEAEVRARSYQTLADNMTNAYNDGNFDFPEDAGAAQIVVEGPMTPLWFGDDLVIARRVRVGDGRYFQGCWVDWPALREWLATSVSDLLPNVRLEPTADCPADGSERRLAALPVRLVPGDSPTAARGGISPIQAALVVAWCCVLLASAAIGVLLFGADSLGRRRAAFASAVTHELRTPLTTFRLYSELLARGTVSDGQKRQQYFETLQVESERLAHLVENVLAYSRLERGRGIGPNECVRLAELVERAGARLAERAQRAGMRLSTQVDPAAGELVLSTNASAVEQILLNLVDNACKYGAASDGRMEIELCAGVVPNGSVTTARIRVRDFGPGIQPGAATRMFRVFHKSAHDAAASAPGVGLGLALSRRLARGLGGDLCLEREIAPGASFALLLPVSPENP